MADIFYLSSAAKAFTVVYDAATQDFTTIDIVITAAADI